MEPVKPGWRQWYHVTITCYGQWLRGDERSWRERGHRLHVAGDYKNAPPPSKYSAAIRAQSRRLMKHEPVEFTMGQRKEVCVHVLRSLEIQAIVARAVAVGVHHSHLLIQCPGANPKVVGGKVKNHAWMQVVNGGDRLKVRQDAPPMWAVGSHAEPIADQAHFYRAFWYVLDHRDEGAFVWCYLDPRDGRRKCVHRKDVGGGSG